MQRGNRIGGKKKFLELWEKLQNIEQPCMKLSEGEKETATEEVITEPSEINDRTKPLIQGTQRTPSKINTLPRPQKQHVSTSYSNC